MPGRGLLSFVPLVEADAEGGQAAQQGADAVHLVGAEAQSAGGYEVVGPVVDEDALRRQLKEAGCEERAEMDFQKALLNGKLPYTVGGGIGQSRICMFYLRKAHIGEVQSSIWPDDVLEEAASRGVYLL